MAMFPANRKKRWFGLAGRSASAGANLLVQWANGIPTPCAGEDPQTPVGSRGVVETCPQTTDFFRRGSPPPKFLHHNVISIDKNLG